MSSDIARPECFFRLIHPLHVAGNIVLERTSDARGKRSKVDSSEAAKVARMSCQVPGVYFSVASYSGLPLLTNFVATNALYLRVNIPKDARQSDYARHAWLRDIYAQIEAKGFVLPTAVTADGNTFTLYWVLDKVIPKTQFYKLFLYQQALTVSFQHLGLSDGGLDISSLVPLVGTIDPSTGQIISLIAYQGTRLDHARVESLLASMIRPSEFERLKMHAAAVIELLKLFHDRTLSFDIRTTTEDWVIFFGASLSHFCTRKQLVQELRALAESLEGRPWRKISAKYQQTIACVVNSEIPGGIKSGSVSLSSDQAGWFDWVHGKLAITADEVDRLGLSLLSGDNVSLPNLTGLDSIAGLSIGQSDFIPIERLFIRKVA